MIKFLYFANDNSHAVFCSTMARLSAYYGYDVRCIIEGVNLANPVSMKQFVKHKKSLWVGYGNPIIAPFILDLCKVSSSINLVEYNFSNRASYKCITVDRNSIKANTLFEYFVNNHDDWFIQVNYYHYNSGRLERKHGPGYFAQNAQSLDQIVELMTKHVNYCQQEYETKRATAERFRLKYDIAVEDMLQAKRAMGII